MLATKRSTGLRPECPSHAGDPASDGVHPGYIHQKRKTRLPVVKQKGLLFSNVFLEREILCSITLKHLEAAEITKDATKDAEKGMQLKVIILPPANSPFTLLILFIVITGYK